MIKAGRETFAFFGSGIDLSDQQIDATYHALLNSYNEIQKRIEERRAADRGRPLIQFPKIEIPRISIPFLGINIGGDNDPAKSEAENEATEIISAPDKEL